MRYKRVIFKISGEALSGDKTGIDDKFVDSLALKLKEINQAGIEVSVVVGGGNFWRGRLDSTLNRFTSDSIGMLGTVMNGLALEDRLISNGVNAFVVSAFDIPKLSQVSKTQEIRKRLSNGEIAIFVGGTGNPYFSTDTTTAVRGLEVGAEIALFAKNGVDGCYNKDPNMYSDAKKYDVLSMTEIIEKGLGVIDQSAALLLKEYRIPVIIFGMDDLDNFNKVVSDEIIGTYVKGE
ncbi:MAG: UMP kinase [Tissierellia bacterium]|nr:UMP kinase [Tissierellia bacterium]